MKEKILTSLLTVLALSTLHAQSTSGVQAPRLVVGITIDQLRSDYLEAFATLYGEKGFKRLLKEGRIYRNAGYNFSNVDRASAVASIYSGTTPSRNGIVGAQWLDRSTLRPITCVDDKNFMGIYTAENSSPNRLTVSTFPDELKISSQGRSIVYAIAPQREAAVLAAGHAANGAYWLNDLTGKWCGSTYYGDFPRWLMVYNDNNSTDKRISSLTWEPLRSFNAYDNPTEERSFRYTFNDNRKYRRLKVSPCVNAEVNRVVNACLYGTMLGADPVTDFLSVTYNAGSFQSESGISSYVEMQDTYVRLDEDLASLLEMIDRKVGLQNTLFFVTSTGYAEQQSIDYSAYRVPSGEFYIHRASALLNMYLMAVYGQGQYVEAFDGLQLYLDHKLIEKKQLRMREVLDRSAEFLADLSGVRKVYTSYDLLLGAWSPEIAKVRNSYSPTCSGDLIIQVNAGWKLMDADSNELKTVREASVNFPLIFLGPGIHPKTIHTPVSVDCVAPTLSSFMRIRAPNACVSSPLTDVRE